MTKEAAEKRSHDSATSEDDEQIKPKKLKTDEKSPKKVATDNVSVPVKEVDDDGNEYYSLGRDRRISISTFKGKRSINVREYYQDKNSGTMKPGKRGITLNPQEWKNLLAVANHLNFGPESE